MPGEPQRLIRGFPVLERRLPISWARRRRLCQLRHELGNHNTSISFGGPSAICSYNTFFALAGDDIGAAATQNMLRRLVSG